MEEEDKAHVVNGKKGILPFVTTQLDLEDIMLSEISSRKTNTIWSHLNLKCESKNVKFIETG